MSHIFLLLVAATLPSALGQCTDNLERRFAQTSDRMLKAVQEAIETRLAAQTAALEDRLETRLAALIAALEDRLETRLAALIAAQEDSLETRLAAQTASLETSLAAQTAALKNRLAAQTASLAAQTAALENRLAAQTASLAAQTTALEDRLAVQAAALQVKMASLEARLTASCSARDIGVLVSAFQDASAKMAECCESPATTPTVRPSTTPTVRPSTTPTVRLSATPTVRPSATPTVRPSATPVVRPSATPTVRPSTTPTVRPSTTPTTTETPRPVVFLRRQDGSVDFYQGWAAYKSGFGNQAGEFWLGLDELHTLTTRHNYGLRVDLTDWSGETKWAAYSTFRVAGETDGYELSISGYISDSTAGNGMAHNNERFSTSDRDNDYSNVNCADYCQGAWWYRSCGHSNPAGAYKPAGYRGWQGITWYTAYNDRRSFKRITLTLLNA